MPYAYICTECHHPASAHRLVQSLADSVHGPYTCRFPTCKCRITQDTPLTEMNRAEFTEAFPQWDTMKLRGVSS